MLTPQAVKIRPDCGKIVMHGKKPITSGIHMRKNHIATPLNEASLNDLALSYVSRYATSRAKLFAYLQRKLRERGWGGERPADPDAVADRMVELRYIDDGAYAAMKADAMVRRGYGKRRLSDIYFRDGIAEDDRAEADRLAEDGRWDAAVTFARKKRVGAFAPAPLDPDQQRRALAAFLRAGHDMALARLLISLEPGADIDQYRPDAD